MPCKENGNYVDRMIDEITKNNFNYISKEEDMFGDIMDIVLKS